MARVVLILGRRRARTRDSPLSCRLSLCCLGPRLAGGARLVSPPPRSSGWGTQPRAHSPTRFPRRARPGSQLSAGAILCRRDLGRRQGYAARRAFHLRTQGATALALSLRRARPHLRSLPRPHPRHVRRHAQHPTPVGEKKGHSGPRVQEGR